MSLWVFACSDAPERPEEFRRQATRVIISAPEGVEISLFAAADDLDGLRPAPLSGEEAWLERGRWVVRAGEGERSWYYPVTVTSARSGPDNDGSITVSVRRLSSMETPRLLGADLVAIPSGWSLFGDRQNPQEVHHVWRTTYFMMPGEVTNRSFREFLASSDGWRSDANWSPEGSAWRRESTTRSSAALTPDHPEYERFGGDDHPVTNVTWYEASAFARWATRLYGGGRWEYALPSEPEWEKAARGPDDLEFSLAQTISDRETGWFNWRKNPGADTTVVPWPETLRRYRPNRYGVYHMAGNVTEWTRSMAIPFSQKRPYRDDGRDRDDGSGQRVARGGSWYSASVALLRTSYRDSFLPEHRTPELGFRLRALRLPGPPR